MGLGSKYVVLFTWLFGIAFVARVNAVFVSGVVVLILRLSLESTLSLSLELILNSPLELILSLSLELILCLSLLCTQVGRTMQMRQWRPSSAQARHKLPDTNSQFLFLYNLSVKLYLPHPLINQAPSCAHQTCQFSTQQGTAFCSSAILPGVVNNPYSSSYIVCKQFSLTRIMPSLHTTASSLLQLLKTETTHRMSSIESSALGLLHALDVSDRSGGVSTALVFHTQVRHIVVPPLRARGAGRFPLRHGSRLCDGMRASLPPFGGLVLPNFRGLLFRMNAVQETQSTPSVDCPETQPFGNTVDIRIFALGSSTVYTEQGTLPFCLVVFLILQGQEHVTPLRLEESRFAQIRRSHQ